MCSDAESSQGESQNNTNNEGGSNDDGNDDDSDDGMFQHILTTCFVFITKHVLENLSNMLINYVSTYCDNMFCIYYKTCFRIFNQHVEKI